MKILTTILLLFVIATAAGCGENESTRHAKNTVDLLRRFETQVRSGLPKLDAKRTFADAQYEFRKINPSDMNERGYKMLELSLQAHEIFLTTESEVTMKIFWDQALETREDAAKELF